MARQWSMDSELLLRFRGLLSVRDPRLGIRLYSDIYIRSRISQLRLSLNGPLCAGRSQSRSLTSPAHTTLTNCYQWRIAAAYSAKNRVFKPKQNLYSFRHPGCTPFLPGQSQLSVDSAVKRPDSGQDSFFVSSIGRSRLVAFGVVGYHILFYWRIGRRILNIYQLGRWRWRMGPIWN